MVPVLQQPEHGADSERTGVATAGISEGCSNRAAHQNCQTSQL